MKLTVTTSAAIAAILVCCAGVRAQNTVDFSRDIKPILVDQCYACHGPDEKAREGGFHFDDRQSVIDARALEPGNPDESELIRRIFSSDADEVMPPPHSRKTLTEVQKKLLVDWIRKGANYSSHWAFIAPVKPEVPALGTNEWVRNPIDALVLNKLQEVGLSPAPEADIHTLIRRVSLDLTGLPPTPDQVKQVLADSAPDRYERFVDQLLAQPQWGEQRGRYWLDYARYADTHGVHFDNYREIWSYRDWVISAFNRNMPFDQFTIEQLAGDLLPNPTREQLIGTGFNRCNITTNEGGAIDEEYYVLYTRDRVETTSVVWMGLTTGCAVCHDHKYDPIKQTEFYELAAFFNNTTQAAMDGNIRDTPPVINVPKAEDIPRFEALAAEMAAAKAGLEQARVAGLEKFNSWHKDPETLKNVLSKQGPKISDCVFQLPLNDGTTDSLAFIDRSVTNRITLEKPAKWEPGWVGDQAWVNQAEVQPTFDEVGDFERDQAFSVSLWVQTGDARNGALIARMDDQNDFRGWDVWLQDGRVAMHLINKWPQDALKVVSRDPIDGKQWNHVVISYDGTSKEEGIKILVNGKAVKKVVEKNELSSTIRTKVPFRLGGRHSSAPTSGAKLQDVRFVQRAVSEMEAKDLFEVQRLVYLLEKPTEKITDAERDSLRDLYLQRYDEKFSEANEQLNRLNKEQLEIERRGTVAYIMQEKPSPPSAYVLFRGQYDQRRDQVFPNTPRVLPPYTDDQKNRLGLARWLLSPDHPLTARVTVNRFWQEVFGQGIVASSGDFGTTGQLPSNQPLLDYLAIDFRENGWDVKRLFKMMVTSATYRQSAVVSPVKFERDPANIYLARGPRFRMDAEMVRDIAIKTSGLLSQKIGGPSVRPYQPGGVWEAVAMPESNTRNYVQDSDDGLYRRSMYTFWKRAAPPASMEILNAPSREVCTVRRDRTNTPLQALLTLNDPQFIEASRELATRALVQTNHEGDQDMTKKDLAAINFISMSLLGREFRAEELSIVEDSLKDLRQSYIGKVDEADLLLKVGAKPVSTSIERTELAAWTMLVNQLMNLDEVLNK